MPITPRIAVQSALCKSAVRAQVEYASKYSDYVDLVYSSGIISYEEHAISDATEAAVYFIIDHEFVW